MFHENDPVKLRHAVPADSIASWPDVPSTTLQPGTLGTVVMVYNNGEAYEVEFVASDGSTLGLLTLSESYLEPYQ